MELSGFLILITDFRQLQNAVTLGCCSILLGVVFHFGFSDAGTKALVAIPILFFASTVGAHALIRGTYHFGIKLGKKSVKDDYKETVK